MHRTSTVTAMVQSSGGVIILMSVVLVVVLPAAHTSAKALEHPATVELLPNDLVSEDQETESTNKVIATPKQVIEHQVNKTWRSILRQMLEETRTSVKQKRTLPNPTTNLATVVALFVLLLKAGIFSQASNPTGAFSASQLDTVSSIASGSMVSELTNKDPMHAVPVPVPDITSGSMVPNLGPSNSLHSVPVVGNIASPSLVHSAPDTLTGGGLVSEYAGGGLVPGLTPDVPVDVGHATGIADSPSAIVPPQTHVLTPTNLASGLKPMGSYGL